jgi:hypothetical protein
MKPSLRIRRLFVFPAANLLQNSFWLVSSVPMAGLLPSAITKDTVFSYAVRDAAISWKQESTCVFCIKHRENVESVKHGTPSTIVASIFFALHFSYNCVRTFSQDAVNELATSVENIEHLNYFPPNGSYTVARAQEIVGLIQSDRMWGPAKKPWSYH